MDLRVNGVEESESVVRFGVSSISDVPKIEHRRLIVGFGHFSIIKNGFNRF